MFNLFPIPLLSLLRAVMQTKIVGGDGYDETARLSVEMTLLLTTKRKE